MRLFHQWEIEKLLKISNRKNISLEDNLSYDEIEIVHTNLRKNVQFYLNNYITLMPANLPRSVYVNIRIDKREVSDVVEGKIKSYNLNIFI